MTAVNLQSFNVEKWPSKFLFRVKFYANRIHFKFVIIVKKTWMVKIQSLKSEIPCRNNDGRHILRYLISVDNFHNYAKICKILMLC